MKKENYENLPPLSVVVCEKHTFKTEVAHPLTGEPALPTMWVAIDLATLRILGQGFGLPESRAEEVCATAIGDCIRSGIGLPRTVYINDESLDEEKIKSSDHSLGRFARELGIKFKVGNPDEHRIRQAMVPILKIIHKSLRALGK